MTIIAFVIIGVLAFVLSVRSYDQGYKQGESEGYKKGQRDVLDASLTMLRGNGWNSKK
jgi:uncharacterized membrane protein